MPVLLFTIGSRGDFQPLLALEVQLRQLGADVRLCALPDFRELADGHGLPFVPTGPRRCGRTRLTNGARPSLADLRKLKPATGAAQFATLRSAAADCDVIVRCNQRRSPLAWLAGCGASATSSPPMVRSLYRRRTTLHRRCRHSRRPKPSPTTAPGECRRLNAATPPGAKRSTSTARRPP